MIIFLFPLISILTAIFLSLILGLIGAIAIENANSAKAISLLKLNGHQWATINPDGMKIIVQGNAPDSLSQNSALNILQAQFNSSQIVDQIRVNGQALPKSLRPSIRLQKFDTSIIAFGTTENEVARQTIIDKLNQAFPDMTAEVIIQSLQGNSSPEWQQIAGFAVHSLTLPQVSLVETDNSSIVITGLAQNEITKQTIISQLDVLKPKSIDVEYRFALNPLPAVSPYTYQIDIFLTHSDLKSCYAENLIDRDRILAVATGDSNQQAGDCQLAVGAPDEYWALAIEYLTSTVRAAGGGSILAKDNRFYVTASDDLSYQQLQSSGFANLPVGYQVSLISSETNELQDNNEDILLIISKLADGQIEFSGAFPDQNSRRVALLTSSVTYDSIAIEDHTIINPSVSYPSGNSLQLANEALSLLHSGFAILKPNEIVISGVSDDALTEDMISDLFALESGQTVYRLNIRYDSTINAPPPPMNARLCVKRLNDTQKLSKITFEPGSSRINADALDNIQQIADILENCQHVPIEVSGHTDSQGRESMNQQLSERRARAVLDAILDTGLTPMNLTSMGYGETRPISDNSTKEGQEQNRRIEFQLFDDRIFAPQ